ncbi:MAG: divergent polysaccharide deacetylase family protein [Sulfitobacter sp.]
MIRGFLGGALSGGVLSFGVAIVASALAPSPQSPQVDDAAPGGGVLPVVANTSGTTGSTVDSSVQVAQAATQASAPDPDTLSALDDQTVASTQAPQTGQVSGLVAPETGAAEGGVTLEGEEPVLPNPQALAPMVPQEADDISISTEPAQPPRPVVTPQENVAGAADPEPSDEVALAETETSIDAPVAEPTDAPDRQITAETSIVAPEAPAVPDIPEEETAIEVGVAETSAQENEVASAEPDPSEDAARAADEAAVAPQQTPAVVAQSPEPPQLPDDTAENTAEPAPAATPAKSEPTPDNAADDLPDVATAQGNAEETPEPSLEVQTPDTETPDPSAETAEAPQVAVLTPSARPQIGTPAISLTERDTGVTVNRLVPSNDDPSDVPSVTVITEEGASPSSQDARPIVRYAQSFANSDDKPLMSIVLIDTGTSPTAGAAGIAALRSFPYTLSFAVDSNLADAAERMTLYREAGFEVLAMVDLPPGAQASDAETTLGVTLSQMGDVVGVLEGIGAGLQGSRVVSDQVTEILRQSGHGLVTQDKGLNTMPKLAVKEGVPAAPIFRDFDSKDQTATVIRRFLDQAAFKAGQEGAVIMLGRLRPDTISALLLWGLQDRAGQVALAPISAVLLATQEE